MSWFEDKIDMYQPSYVDENINDGFRYGKLEMIEDGDFQEVLVIMEKKDVSTDSVGSSAH